MTHIQKDIEAILGECVGELIDKHKRIACDMCHTAIYDETMPKNMPKGLEQYKRAAYAHICFVQDLEDVRNRIPETARKVLERVRELLEGKKLLEVGLNSEALRYKQAFNRSIDDIIASLAGKDEGGKTVYFASGGINTEKYLGVDGQTGTPIPKSLPANDTDHDND